MLQILAWKKFAALLFRNRSEFYLDVVSAAVNNHISWAKIAEGHDNSSSAVRIGIACFDSIAVQTAVVGMSASVSNIRIQIEWESVFQSSWKHDAENYFSHFSLKKDSHSASFFPNIIFKNLS